VDVLSPEQVIALGEIFTTIANKLHPGAVEVMTVGANDVQDHTRQGENSG